MALTLYRQVGKGKARRYQEVNLGRGRRPADLTVPTFCGIRSPTAPVPGTGWRRPRRGKRRADTQAASFEARDLNVPVVQDQDEAGRTKITDAVYQWSFSCFKARIGKARARRRCGHTTTIPDSSSTSRRRTTCAMWISSTASSPEHISAHKGHLYSRQNPVNSPGS
jgi:hypothetical protein